MKQGQRRVDHETYRANVTGMSTPGLQGSRYSSGEDRAGGGRDVDSGDCKGKGEQKTCNKRQMAQGCSQWGIHGWDYRKIDSGI
jgi:hypothetical protein